MRCTPHEVHAYKVHDYGVHACEVHVYDVYAHEVHAHETYAYEMHARKVRGKIFRSAHPNKRCMSMPVRDMYPVFASATKSHSPPVTEATSAPQTPQYVIDIRDPDCEMRHVIPFSSSPGAPPSPRPPFSRCLIKRQQ